VAREQSGVGKIAGSDVLWGSDNFWQPPYRSYPHPPTELEQMASRLGIDDDEFRALIHDAIQRRLREKGEAWDKLDRTLEMRANGRPAKA